MSKEATTKNTVNSAYAFNFAATANLSGVTSLWGLGWFLFHDLKQVPIGFNWSGECCTAFFCSESLEIFCCLHELNAEWVLKFFYFSKKDTGLPNYTVPNVTDPGTITWLDCKHRTPHANLHNRVYDMTLTVILTLTFFHWVLGINITLIKWCLLNIKHVTLKITPSSPDRFTWAELVLNARRKVCGFSPIMMQIAQRATLIVSARNVLCLMSFLLGPLIYSMSAVACIIHGKLFYKRLLNTFCIQQKIKAAVWFMKHRAPMSKQAPICYWKNRLFPFPSLHSLSSQKHVYHYRWWFWISLSYPLMIPPNGFRFRSADSVS